MIFWTLFALGWIWLGVTVVAALCLLEDIGEPNKDDEPIIIASIIFWPIFALIISFVTLKEKFSLSGLGAVQLIKYISRKMRNALK